MKRTFIACLTTVLAMIGAVLALGVTSTPTAAGATMHSRAAVAHHAGAKAQHTTITLHVDTCPHCPVRLVQAAGGNYWHSPTKHIDHGVVSFRVLTRHTQGMSFEIHPRWSSADYVPNIVTRYVHTQVGDVVTNDVARHKQRAEGCWEGTSARTISLDVRAVKFPLRDVAGNPGHSIRAWFKPTLASIGPMVGATKGTIGNQDAFYCNR